MRVSGSSAARAAPNLFPVIAGGKAARPWRRTLPALAALLSGAPGARAGVDSGAGAAATEARARSTGRWRLSAAALLVALAAALPPATAKAQAVAVCDRTTQVRDAIVAAVTGVTDCANVTATDLAAISSLAITDDSSLTSLQAGDFGGLTGLTTLRLNNNGLTTLPANIFDELMALTDLRLNRNGLTTLPADIFDGLTGLMTLRLNNNGLTTLPANIFDELTALTDLSLSENGLTPLPAGVFDELRELTSLGLNENGLTTLPANIFDELTALTSLSLSGNGLTSLPANIFDRLTRLTLLNLSNNTGLSLLPAGVFDNLTELTVLSLGGNGLTSLPDGVFNRLTALTELYLEYNSLSSLPAGVFDNLTALTHLYLDNNGLTSLPDGVFNRLTALTTLTLSGNSLASLPASVFDPLTELTALELQGNTGAPFSPVGNAGADRSAATGATVTLAGRATGAWGDNVTWQWTQVDGASSNTAVSGGGVTLTDATTVTPEFTAPAAATTLYFRLVVTPVPGADNAFGREAGPADWVTIEVSGSAPPQTNTAPTVANAIPDQAATADRPFRYTVPGNTFSDGQNDPLTWSASKGDDTALPSWLTFDPGTRLFSGTPAVADAGTLAVKVTASDGSLSAEDTFDIKVAATDVCHRTAAVRDAIVAAVTGVTDCADVTVVQLAGLTGSLSLSDKGLTTLQAGDFNGLTGLTVLWLDNNDLTSLPAGIFDDLTALTTLELFFNGLATLPANVFDNLTQLTVLNLNSNSLASLPDDPFDNLTRLTELGLAFNRLPSLPANVFDNLAQLTDLALNNNRLATLPAGIFAQLTMLTQLRLEGNPGAIFKPVANAGAGRTVTAGEPVTLAGSATGPWGDNVTWAWTQVDGPSSTTAVSSGAVTLTDATTATPSFTVPASATTLHFRLVVTPAQGRFDIYGREHSDPDWVTIVVIDADLASGVCARKGHELVSNMKRSWMAPTSAYNTEVAQAFTTGPHTDGYTLESIEAKLAVYPTISGQSNNNTLTVRLWRGSPDEPASTLVATLDRQVSRIGMDQNLTFCPHAPTTLLASTEYWVVMSADFSAGWDATLATGQDVVSHRGWSIDDRGHRRAGGSFVPTSYRSHQCEHGRCTPVNWSPIHKLRVRGSVNSGTPGEAETEAPEVTEVAVQVPPGGDGMWSPGETVEVRVTFDEAVDVDIRADIIVDPYGDDGTPELGLGLSDSGRELLLGWRLAERVSSGLAFELGLEATRRTFEDEAAGAEHGVVAGAGWRLVTQGTESIEVRIEGTLREAANDDAPLETGLGLRLGVSW